MSNLLIAICILAFILLLLTFELIVDPTLFKDERRFMGRLYLMVSLSISLVMLGIYLTYLATSFIINT